MRRAAELFDGRGYDAVSVKDIADSLGWPKSLIYYYCTSKEELVMKAAGMRADAVIGDVEKYIGECAGGNIERLSRALSCVTFWYDGDPKTAARLISTLYQPSGALPWRVYLRAALLPVKSVRYATILSRTGSKIMKCIRPIRAQCAAHCWSSAPIWLKSWLRSSGRAAAARLTNAKGC